MCNCALQSQSRRVNTKLTLGIGTVVYTYLSHTHTHIHLYLSMSAITNATRLLFHNVMSNLGVFNCPREGRFKKDVVKLNKNCNIFIAVHLKTMQ